MTNLEPNRSLTPTLNSDLEQLRENLESGAIEAALGERMAQHVRQGLSEAHAMLLYHADDVRDSIEAFFYDKCGVPAMQVAGACRRRGIIGCVHTQRATR